MAAAAKYMSLSARTKLSAVTVTVLAPEGAAVAVMVSLLLFEPLDIGQLPGLLKQRLFGAVEAEEDFELALGVGRHPVGVLVWRRGRAEIHVYRTVGVLLHLPGVGRAAGARHVADQRVGLSVVRRRRPVLLRRRVCGDAKAIRLATLEWAAILVLARHEIELGRAKALDPDI